jgi:uncharacterized membrane protein
MKILSILVFLMLLSPTINASLISEYYIINEKVLVNHYIERNEKIELPYDYTGLSNSTDINIIKKEELTIIETNKPTNLSYITKTLIEKSTTGNLFILSNKMPQDKILIFLPAGNIIHKDEIIYPKNPTITTNGINIILEYKNISEDVLIKYTKINETNYIPIIIIGILLIFLLIKNKSKEKKKTPNKKIKNKNNSELTKNLIEEEKQIIEYLSNKKKPCWTKEISRELNIPKVRLSRKLKSLEKKSLIKKENFGKENRISLIKK